MGYSTEILVDRMKREFMSKRMSARRRWRIASLAKKADIDYPQEAVGRVPPVQVPGIWSKLGERACGRIFVDEVKGGNILARNSILPSVEKASARS